jgi:hypothetical protein
MTPALWRPTRRHPMHQLSPSHTIANIRMEDVMHLHVYIYDHRLLALLDTGSTHNLST